MVCGASSATLHHGLCNEIDFHTPGCGTKRKWLFSIANVVGEKLLRKENLLRNSNMYELVTESILQRWALDSFSQMC